MGGEVTDLELGPKKTFLSPSPFWARRKREYEEESLLAVSFPPCPLLVSVTQNCDRLDTAVTARQKDQRLPTHGIHDSQTL